MRNAVRVVVLAVTLGAGCGDQGATAPDAATGGDDAVADAAPVVGDTDWRSGTRLRARLLGSAEAALLVGWRDTQLGVDCDWIEGPDGMLRCYPARAGVFYADAGCTQAVVEAPAAQALAPYVRRGYFACDLPTTYAVGAVTAPPSELHYGVPGACIAFGAPAPGSVFHATTPMDLGLLMSGTHALVPRGPRLALDVVTGSDGSWDARAIADTTRGIHCNRTTFDRSQPATRCEPDAVINPSGAFADDTCQGPRLGYFRAFRAAPFCSDPPGGVLITPVQDGGQRYATPGAEHLGTIYSPTNQTCEAAAAFPENRHFLAGAEIDPAVWAPLTTTVEGAGRLRLEALTTSTGERLSAVGFRDDQRGHRCTDILAADGQRRCLPSDSAGMSYWADAGCTVPVNMRATGAPAPTSLVNYLTGEPACGDAYCAHIYTVATLTDLSTLHGGSPADCYATAPIADQAYYVATGEIAPTAFVALTTRTE